MNDPQGVAPDHSARFDKIEQLLNSYPEVSDEQLGELKRWFKKEASAFEVASLASKHPAGYTKFRTDHVDKFSKIEILGMGLVAFAILALILLFV